MKQPQYSPMSVADQAITLFGANRGYFDDVPLEKALSFEKNLHQFARTKYQDLWNRIETNKDLPEADEKALAAAIEDFKKTGTY